MTVIWDGWKCLVSESCKNGGRRGLRSASLLGEGSNLTRRALSEISWVRVEREDWKYWVFELHHGIQNCDNFSTAGGRIHAYEYIKVYLPLHG